ncbi:unnamed protein product [Chironomus riparius]|uniref:Essential protein Yae1 N-terminal domain-containing protein n=1 Tax=Chironomus riparius TaxID=315576 RepID=A0A9N9RZL1_9DIPT|nr:unnamed protein product [Chironomus riparius]
MEDNTTDELFEITAKNYQKLSQNLEKEGFREGKSDGSDKIFQKSFDSGYEDGFKIGFCLGRRKDSKAKLGRCQLCINKQLMEMSEVEAREIVNRNYETILKEPPN